MNIVLDTNVLLSGLGYPDSIPSHIVNAWRNNQFTLLTSEYLLAGLIRTLPRIKKLGWNTDETLLFIESLRFRSTVIETKHVKTHVPQDPDDEPILAILIASNADYLITGDKDLLALAKNYPILTPAEFYQRHC